MSEYGPKEFGRFYSVARSGQESIAQGLPWVKTPTRISPEGATRYGGNRLRTFELNRVRISSPFRAKRLFRLTQGKPWAKLSCPFGAGLSDRMTAAKHKQVFRGQDTGAFPTHRSRRSESDAEGVMQSQPRQAPFPPDALSRYGLWPSTSICLMARPEQGLLLLPPCPRALWFERP